MAEETISLSPLSDQNNEREVNNLTEPSDKLLNKCSKNHETGNMLLDNGKTDTECVVKITNEKLYRRLYLSENSTSNLISHLARIHQITKNTKIEGNLVQTTITNTVKTHKEVKQKELRQSLVD
ncbi:14901_t:CDS:2 [Funneliformis caledonium]|uniref:14901_t:CDS:1 n=1 Tax=Funneliformis caledonium TaxID=1117310 RepID=A0A9N8YVE6_9GLOM|nr:14901_t:CDS:2 [Funneliformis caledonium]